MSKINPSPIYRTSAPGSLMLFGEHAVLHGELAIVAAIDQRLTVNIRPRQDQTVNLYSKSSGKKKFELKNLSKIIKEKNFGWHFVLACLINYQEKINTGFDLEVTSNQVGPIGLGSSAAVTVATIVGLEKWLYKKILPKKLLFAKALKIVRKAQGRASGADVAASVFGGILAYSMKPTKIEAIKGNLPLYVVYSGKKVATREVLLHVRARTQGKEQIFYELYKCLGECAVAAKTNIANKNFKNLGEIMDIHQNLQEALGVSNDTLTKIISALKKLPGVLGAKISGAGLGDCIIALYKGRPVLKKTFLQKYPVVFAKITNDGVG